MDRNGRASVRPAERPWDQACETKPIHREHEERQMLSRERVMMNWPPKGLRQNKANCPARPEVGRDRRTLQRSCLGVSRAKQSQFASRAQKWARGGKATGGATSGPSVRNKANLQRSFKCEVSSEQSPAASPPSLPTSHFKLPTCETKPIPTEHKEGQLLYREGVMVNRALKGLWQNKANFSDSSTGRPMEKVCTAHPTRIIGKGCDGLPDLAPG